MGDGLGLLEGEHLRLAADGRDGLPGSGHAQEADQAGQGSEGEQMVRFVCGTREH